MYDVVRFGIILRNVKYEICTLYTRPLTFG